MKEIQTEIQYDSPYLPILLRQAREAKGWSQESVAHGLCAVSYLSKTAGSFLHRIWRMLWRDGSI